MRGLVLWKVLIIWRLFSTAVAIDFYSLTARLLNSGSPPVQFREELKNKVVLVVNVASECGYTDSHYPDLDRMQNILGEEYFRILGFPSNDFGAQEPGSEKEILAKIWQRFGIVSITLMEKISILSETARHPIYQFILDSTSTLPEWNFYKYLINHEGRIIGIYPHYKTVSDIFDDVQAAIKIAEKNTKSIQEKDEL